MLFFIPQRYGMELSCIRQRCDNVKKLLFEILTVNTMHEAAAKVLLYYLQTLTLSNELLHLQPSKLYENIFAWVSWDNAHSWDDVRQEVRGLHCGRHIPTFLHTIFLVCFPPRFSVYRPVNPPTHCELKRGEASEREREEAKRNQTERMRRTETERKSKGQGARRREWEGGRRR